MSELDEKRIELNRILDRISISGSFEAARLSKNALSLGTRIVELSASEPEAEAEKPKTENKPEAAA